MPDPIATRQVLIIEDDEDLSELLGMWLREHYGDRVAVHLATTIEEGNQHLDSLARIDVVLLDRHFPEGSGEDLLETLTRRFNAIIVMITAVTPQEGIIRLPITDYMVKPIDYEGLVKRLALLEKLKAAGVIDAYADARKASLLEYHLDDPEANPLFRRFAARWSYDRIEVVHDGERTFVYELYVSETPDSGNEISVHVVGTVADTLGALVELGELAPVGELVPSSDRFAWVDVERSGVVEPPPDGFVVYEFAGETPEEFVEIGEPEDSRRVERVLEDAYR